MVTHDIGAITVHANKLICLGSGVTVHDINEPVTDEFFRSLRLSGANSQSPMPKLAI